MNAKECKIFVTVGSRNYPFDRLFIKLDELFERKNSLEINTVDINIEINKLMSKVRDVSKKLVRSMVFGNVDKTSW